MCMDSSDSREGGNRAYEVDGRGYRRLGKLVDRTVMWGDMGGGVDSSNGRGWGEWCRLIAVTVEGAVWRPVTVEMM